MVAEEKVPKSKFDTKDIFIFDCGMEVFVWIGKKSSKNEKRIAIQYAQDYLHKYKRPVWIPITKLNEGGETDTFNSFLDPEDTGRKFVINKKN